MPITPGIWMKGKCGAIVTDDHSLGVCDPDAEHFYGGHFVCESVGGADADLIVAAPSLLQAAEEIATDLSGWSRRLEADPDSCDRLASALTAAAEHLRVATRLARMGRPLAVIGVSA